MPSIQMSESLCKFETSDSTEEDIKTDPHVAVQFDSSVNIAGRAPRPALSRHLSVSSTVSSLDIRKHVEPQVALPPIFKTLSYKVDDETEALERSKIDKSARSFKQNTWHCQSAAEVAKSLSTDLKNGLCDAQYREHCKEFGANVLSPPRTNWLKKIIVYFFGGFGLLLMVGGILCCICWKPLGNPNPSLSNLVLGVVLLMVFLLQAFFNFWQDFSSSQVMKSINSMIPSTVPAIRNGLFATCEAKDLVPGDLILIKNGDRLPADVRFVSSESSEFSFDRSILTGESKPIHATVKADSKDSNYLESCSIGLQGTFCVGGSGCGLVVATGDNTVFGQIARLSSDPKKGTSPLQRDIIRFVVCIVLVMLILLVIVCIVWGAYLRKHYPEWINVPELIVDLVSVFVSFIPEGLPIALTTCLMITAGVMKKNKILCKSLNIVETLGSVSVLCSDKTGTLTKNKMSVVSHSVGCAILDPQTCTKGQLKVSQLSKLCNSSVFDPTTLSRPLNERVISGNATDQAIYRFGYELSEDDMSMQLKSEISFNSSNKFMVRLYEDGSELEFMIKGAPDILINKCSKILTADGDVLPLTIEHLRCIDTIQDKWASEGQRVVLLAYKKLSYSRFSSCGFSSKETTDTLLSESQDLVLAGLVGIADPPKDDILDVVTTLHNAGIRVNMVTGDMEPTAIAIARMCGIVTHTTINTMETLDPQFEMVNCRLSERRVIDEAISIRSGDLNNLNDNQWEHLTCFAEIVFSRTTPEQKLKIVEEFQKRSHVVAMTGDGVNDAPSLRQADVGIAMAEGSDIAKESADLVLLDSFSSIVMALKYGRLVFENLRKTIAYLLPAGTFAELWAVLFNVLFGAPQMLSSFCMIMISCLTDCGSAITLAYEKPEKQLLLKKPRSITGETIVDWKLLLNFYFIVGTYDTFVAMMMSFLYYQEHGVPFSALVMSFGQYPDGIDSEKVARLLSTASSIYFVTLVILQLFNLMCVRTRTASVFHQSPIHGETKNLAMIPAMCFALGVTFFFNYIPWFQQNIGTGVVPWKNYLIACAFGALLMIWDELRKYNNRMRPSSFLAKIAW